jgi:hypothetical protein
VSAVTSAPLSVTPYTSSDTHINICACLNLYEVKLTGNEKTEEGGNAVEKTEKRGRGTCSAAH